jgi:putative two-component system response regulator
MSPAAKPAAGAPRAAAISSHPSRHRTEPAYLARTFGLDLKNLNVQAARAGGAEGFPWWSLERAAKRGAVSRPKRILVVDDVEQNVVLLATLVVGLGYEVETARDGLDALAKLALDIDLVLLDVMMPGLDGYEVARRLRAEPRWCDLPVIMVTMLDSREDRIRAIQAGASDFIAKPVERTELEVRIGSQLRLKEVQDELRRSQAELEDRVVRRTVELRHALKEMADARRHTYEAHLDTIRRLVLAAELRDIGTSQHILRISHSCAILARALHLPPHEAEVLCQAVTMHDVGKIGIPDAILFKQGRFSDEERQLMQTHTVIGGRILADSSSELLQAGEIIALSHHERWDGEGYPRGLAGEEIPLWGRICAVADVFDAITTPRPYREPLLPEEAMEYLIAGRSTLFDPDLLDLFVAHRDEVFALYQGFDKNGQPTGPVSFSALGGEPPPL